MSDPPYGGFEKPPQHPQTPEPEQTPLFEDQISQKEQELFEVLGVENREGAKELDLDKLDDETIKKATEIKREIEGLRQKKEKETTTGTFENDKREEGWELERDSDDPGPMNIEELELISGDWETVGDAVEDANKELGQRTAEYLLEHQDEIPVEWRGNYLIFPGTEWRSSGGRVPGLGWDGERWVLDFLWLGNRFRSRVRLVCPKK